MSRDDIGWGAPRIHGKLQLLGIHVSQATVSKYMIHHPKPPSQTWRTFLNNHVKDLVSIDFFTVPAATFRILYVFIVLRHDRREVVHFNVTDHLHIVLTSFIILASDWVIGRNSHSIDPTRRVRGKKSGGSIMREVQSHMAAAVCLALFLLNGCTNQAEQITSAPAFRPHSENATTFLNALKTARTAVYPSIVRTFEGTSYSLQSQQQIVSMLNKERITTALAQPGTLAPGEQVSNIQWDIFQSDMHAIARQLKDRKSDEGYSLVMEFLVAQGVGGIHCYIFDQHGENAFSFLLNTHHKLLAEANLGAGDSSEASRLKMIEKATRVGVTALLRQINKPEDQHSTKQKEYSITSRKVSASDRKVERIFVLARLQERLKYVFMHSFKHSLASAFESNGVDAIVKVAPRESDALAKYANEIDAFVPDATMYIDLDPLYRTHSDGHEAIVGTDFGVKLINRETGDLEWIASGKVDYIADRFFKRSGYSVHEGIRKEFAWTTTAAIVRAFIADINGQKSAPIYIVTEDRQRHGQRTD